MSLVFSPLAATMSGSIFDCTDNRSDVNMLVSTSTSSYMITIQPVTAVAQLDDQIASLPTLAASMLDHQSFVHVNSRSVSIYAVTDPMTRIASWEVSRDQEIVSASISKHHIVVAKKGGELVILKADHNGIEAFWYAPSLGTGAPLIVVLQKPIVKSRL